MSGDGETLHAESAYLVCSNVRRVFSTTRCLSDRRHVFRYHSAAVDSAPSTSIFLLRRAANIEHRLRRVDARTRHVRRAPSPILVRVRTLLILLVIMILLLLAVVEDKRLRIVAHVDPHERRDRRHRKAPDDDQRAVGVLVRVGVLFEVVVVRRCFPLGLPIALHAGGTPIHVA
jgi:hypothetical protein